jgi:hypothetical protein
VQNEQLERRIPFKLQTSNFKAASLGKHSCAAQQAASIKHKKSYISLYAYMYARSN